MAVSVHSVSFEAMNNLCEPTQEEVIQSWNDRAHAYDNLIRRWPIFTSMADRLLECISSDFNGHALDIGGGSGLVAERLLNKHPKACVSLIEPAAEMRALATRRLGSCVEIKDVTSDELDNLDFTVDVALCSASFHLMNEKTTLPSVASILRPRSIFSTNLWGHSFDEAIELIQKQDWMQFLDQALAEFDQPPMHRPENSAYSIKSANELRKIGEACGLRLLETKILTTEINTQFNIEFAAMNPNFMNHVEKELRMPVIDCALQLCRGVDIISTVDLKFEKV